MKISTRFKDYCKCVGELIEIIFGDFDDDFDDDFD